MPRALNEPVGLTASSLTQSVPASMPKASPSLFAPSSGVPPSPNVRGSSPDGSGSTSRQRQSERVRPARSSRDTACATAGRS